MLHEFPGERPDIFSQTSSLAVLRLDVIENSRHHRKVFTTQEAHGVVRSVTVHVTLEFVAIEEKLPADGAHDVAGEVVLEKTATRWGAPLTWLAVDVVMLEMVLKRCEGVEIRFVSTETTDIVVEGVLDMSTQAGDG
jgi:hypothetical protein